MLVYTYVFESHVASFQNTKSTLRRVRAIPMLFRSAVVVVCLVGMFDVGNEMKGEI